MNPATTEFVRQRFTEYYRKAMLVSPSSLAQREWGFVLFNSGSAEMRMRRHIAFADRAGAFSIISKTLSPRIFIIQALTTRSRMRPPWVKRAGAEPILS